MDISDFFNVASLFSFSFLIATIPTTPASYPWTLKWPEAEFAKKKKKKKNQQKTAPQKNQNKNKTKQTEKKQK